jgi:hypothetical protein
MENKKEESKIEKFSKAIDQLSTEVFDEQQGYLLFAYGELEEGKSENTFASRGKLSSMAECLYACMKQNEILANIVIAASNAIVQGRMMEAQIQQQAMESTTTKKKRTRKPKN